MKPYYADNRATLYRGDALAVLAALPTASVDALITDPPYSSGGAFRGDRTGDPTSKYVPTKEVINFHPTFTGDNRDQRAYGYWCSLWLNECLRVVKPGGVVAVFTDWRQLPTTTDIVQAGGWVTRGVVVWDKTQGIRPTSGRYRQQAEFIVWGSNGPMPVDYTSPALPGVFTHSPFRDKVHIAGKPLGLMRDLVRIVPEGGTVLDPFAGSGTTGLAALAEGRHFVGVELTEHYAEVAAERLRTVKRGYRDDGQQDALTFEEPA